MCRALVVLALLYAWPITPGDTGVLAIVSVDNGEAADRCNVIKAILEAIGVPFGIYSSATSTGWKLLDRPIQFRVKTCSVSGTSGFTAIAILGDEMAKWRSPSDGANPSKEIMTSLRATTATQPHAKIFAVSSAFSTTDHHAQMVDNGDSEAFDQTVYIGATWEANPTLTEQDTRKLEPDNLKHDREYGSIPTAAGDHPWFDAVIIDQAAADLPAISYPPNGEGSVACIDTGFRRDACGLVILHWSEHKLVVGEVVEVKRPANAPPLVPSQVLTAFAARCAAHRVQAVGTDLHYVETAREHLSNFGLVELPNGQTGKVDVHTVTRDALRERNALIPSAHVALLKQLKCISYKLTSGGGVSITSPRVDGQHGDIASAYCGAVWLAINTVLTNDDAINAESCLQGYDSPINYG